MRALRTTLGLFALLFVTASLAAAQPLSPLVVDWDRYFTVQAQPPMADGPPAGVIWNTSPWGARRIQLLVEGLDGSGQTLDQRVIWLGCDLPPGGHAYFDAAMPPSTPYRVRVFAFTLEMTAGPR